MSKNLKLILQILSDGEYHSGEELGNKLKLTRSAIWKIIKQLQGQEIHIEAKTNRGYRIPTGLELLDEKLILQHVTTKHKKALKNSIIIFDELPSTNTYLATTIKETRVSWLEQIDPSSLGIGLGGDRGNQQRLKPKCKGYICFAEQQTSGKGRLGRQWLSPFAKNIYMSLLWQFSRAPHELGGLGLVVAVAITTALRNYGITDGISLKWPNDVLWHKRKLAGILIELVGETHHIYNAIIGIGLNVNMPPKVGAQITQPWCDISQITTTIPNRNRLSGLLLDSFLSAIADYQQLGLEPFIEKWQKLDVTYGEKVIIITPQKKINGIGFGVDKKGYFLLKDSRSGEILSFASGEVSLRF